jgi:hypothetical protein
MRTDLINDDLGALTAGSGAATKTPANGKFMGYAIADAGVSDTTVRVLLRSMEDVNAETLGLGDLTDVGPVAYAAGRILVADGDSYEDVPVTGPFNLSSAGLLSLDSATVAATGSAQGDAAAIAHGFTLVSAADGTKGVKLPAAAAGGLCIVKNADAANAILKVYPDTPTMNKPSCDPWQNGLQFLGRPLSVSRKPRSIPFSRSIQPVADMSSRVVA